MVMRDNGLLPLSANPVINSLPKHSSSQWPQRVPSPPSCSVGTTEHPDIFSNSSLALGPRYGQLKLVPTGHKVPIPVVGKSNDLFELM